jgi:hypothetical protein
VRAASISLVLAAVLLSAPLFLNVLEGRREGQARPLLYPAAPRVRDAVQSYVDRWPGIELVMLGRPSVEVDFGLGVILASDDTIPPKFDAELREVISEARGDDPGTRIFALRSAYPVREEPESQ